MDRLLVEYLANSLWQLPLLAGSAWLLIRVLRPGLRSQHAAWLLALALGLLLPAMGMHSGEGVGSSGASQQRAIEPEARASTDGMALPLPFASASSGALPVTTPGFAAPVSAVRQGTWVRLRALPISIMTLRWLAALYLVIVALRLIQLADARRRSAQLRAKAVPAGISAESAALLKRCCRAARVAQPELLSSRAAGTPMVIGVRHPALILPVGLAEASSERELAAIFFYELAHIRRHDYLLHLLTQTLSAPLAYHPATQLLHARLRRTREQICDAFAAGMLQSANGYAESLLAVTARLQPRTGSSATSLLSHRSELEVRIMQLLNSSSRRAASRGTVLASFLIAGGVLALCFTLHLKPAVVLAAEVPPPVAHWPITPAAGQMVATDTVTPAATAPALQVSQDAQPNPAPAPAASSRPAPRPPASTQAETPVPDPAQAPQPVLPMAPPAVQPAAPAPPVLSLTVRPEDLSPRLQSQIDAATAKLWSPEFQKQMQEWIEQATRAGERLRSGETQRQLADAQRALAEAQAQINSPEFRRQMEQARLQMEHAQLYTMLDVGPLDEQIARARAQVEADTARLHALEQKRKAELQAKPSKP